MNFNEALETRKVVVRKVFKNGGNSYTVQLMQKIEAPTSDGGINLTALTMGWNNTQKVTCLQNFTEENLKIAGLSVGDYYEDGVDAVFIDDVMKKLFKTLQNKDITTTFNIQVVENFERNEKAKQEPKSNPETKKYIAYEGKPIYRHTSLVSDEANHIFQESDGSEADIAEEIKSTFKLYAGWN